jgi:glycosyltransferase involved in cell wall biosynthesis
MLFCRKLTFCVLSMSLFCSAFAMLSNAQKRLLIFCDNVESVDTKSIGGTERVMIEITKELKAQNFNVGFMDIPYPHFGIGPNQISAYPNFWSDCGVQRHIAKKIQEFQPDSILINLHGIMSYQAACYCYNNWIPFTAFHSCRMPELISHNMGVPRWVPARFVNRFLSKAHNILVPTESFKQELEKELQIERLGKVVLWPHGVDLKRFNVPSEEEKQRAIIACGLQGRKRPFNLYVTRIANEKNIDFFLKSNLPGTKILVGPAADGYKLSQLSDKYPDIVIPGPQQGEALLDYYHCADLFVFTSKHDLFGLVLLEALATGLPIVAFDIAGPKDVVPRGCGVSYLAQTDKEFEACMRQAWSDLQTNKKTLSQQCRTYAEQFSWAKAAEILRANLVDIHTYNACLDHMSNSKFEYAD